MQHKLTRAALLLLLVVSCGGASGPLDGKWKFWTSIEPQCVGVLNLTGTATGKISGSYALCGFLEGIVIGQYTEPTVQLTLYSDAVSKRPFLTLQGFADPSVFWGLTALDADAQWAAVIIQRPLVRWGKPLSLPCSAGGTCPKPPAGP